MMRSHLAAALLATTCLTQPASATTKPIALTAEPAEARPIEFQVRKIVNRSVRRRGALQKVQFKPLARRRRRPWWRMTGKEARSELIWRFWLQFGLVLVVVVMLGWYKFRNP